MGKSRFLKIPGWQGFAEIAPPDQKLLNHVLYYFYSKRIIKDIYTSNGHIWEVNLESRLKNGEIPNENLKSVRDKSTFIVGALVLPTSYTIFQPDSMVSTYTMISLNIEKWGFFYAKLEK